MLKTTFRISKFRKEHLRFKLALYLLVSSNLVSADNPKSQNLYTFLGILITGCLLAVQGFADIGTAYDALGWSTSEQTN